MTVGASRGDRSGEADARPYPFTPRGGTEPARVLLGGRRLPHGAGPYDPGTVRPTDADS